MLRLVPLVDAADTLERKPNTPRRAARDRIGSFCVGQRVRFLVADRFVATYQGP